MEGIDLDLIEEFEYIELDEVYDVTIEDNHNYFIYDDILVHNSSKTYSTCQYLFYICLNQTGKLITVARDNLNINRRTVFKDFEEIVKASGVSYKLHKAELTITIRGNLIRFIGLDDSAKLHGMKHDICYVNEGLDTTLDKYNQILQRTSEKLIIDYNPSKTDHFLYDWIDKRDDLDYLRTNIFDNPLAPEESVKQILSYEPTEENIARGTANEYFWKVYGLGERFKGDDIVFKEWSRHDWDAKEDCDWICYGGDFGWTNPATLVEVVKKGRTLYLRVMLNESGLTNEDIANKVKSNPDIDLGEHQVWDSEDPKSITELRLLDVPAIPAKKGGNSVYLGMQKLLGYKLSVYKDELSEGLIEEFKNTRYKTDINGNVLRNSKGIPIIVKGNGGHLSDATRYAVRLMDNTVVG